ncbi:hypothetical protein AVO45_02205 [Ruegeria marisrubri]|uniref:Excinuclease ABC subunit A n=1 Tax=Ruegeria marisrubri TaxID=1685379 RepID=A0A117KH61_9RHOB|nr:hypothetical protein [Ruegeria marisrubri]KUJ85813.1 hypothetical protein AVO45_02205 [Ruegeria marisrubri]
MKRPTCTAIILALVLSPAAAMAGNGNGKGKGRDKSEFKVERVDPGYGVKPGRYAKHCPPGLAKKAVPCVPPGQVKNRYRVGDYINGGYDWIDDPYRYGLRRGGYYVRAGDYVYQIDKETHEVLNLIGAVADILD